MKNDDYLQKYVREKRGSELSLLMDSKTRWNSLLFILDCFYILRNCIRKALIDIKSSVIFTEDEFDTISHIITALEPVKLAVEAFCRQDTNMLTAEATQKFMINTLKMQNSAVGKELIQA